MKIRPNAPRNEAIQTDKWFISVNSKIPVGITIFKISEIKTV